MNTIIFIIIIVILFKFRHTKIKFKTFLRKGFAPKRGKFGVYCYCGKQGSGKTYSAVEFLLNSLKIPIYSNVHLKGIKYTYFSGFDKLLELRNESNCIIVYDEIFTALTKTSRINNEVLDFLSQMRKRQIVFITTAQEWLEIPMTLRRYCRYQIDCKMINLLGLGILIKHCYDAEQMKWSQNDNEYVAPLIETTISKCNIKVANSYDTFEQIKT
ncbi:MAG: AAA family ATPase [Bacilli bacterium]|nr:AAA family ATPase [Bacilli bacterium]